MTEPIEPGGGNPAPDAAPALIVARAVTTAPVSADREARTVDVVWSTGARAQNFVPGLGEITEELEMSASAVRMAMLSSGNAPVLNTHRRSDATAVLGRVVEARIERGIGTVTLRFSSASDVEPVWQRVLDGSLRNISVGYRVFRYEQRPDAATGKTIHRAVDWEPFEISVVPIPVDRAASVRGEGVADMPEPIIPTPDPEPEEQSMTDIVPPAPPAVPPVTQENPVTTTPTTPVPPVPACSPTTARCRRVPRWSMAARLAFRSGRRRRRRGSSLPTGRRGPRLLRQFPHEPCSQSGRTPRPVSDFEGFLAPVRGVRMGAMQD